MLQRLPIPFVSPDELRRFPLENRKLRAEAVHVREECIQVSLHCLSLGLHVPHTLLVLDKHAVVVQAEGVQCLLTNLRWKNKGERNAKRNKAT